MKSLLLLSAGLDSTVVGKQAYDRGELQAAVTFDYGQKAAAREIANATAFCGRYGVLHTVIDLPWLKPIAGGLSCDDTIPHPGAGVLGDQGTAAAVWVPNRNGIFIAIAAALAEAAGYEQLLLGLNSEEAQTFPDNSPEFVAATNSALQYSTDGRVRVVAELSYYSKTEIVQRGIACDAPFDLVWPCYHGYAAPCGKCESCLRYNRARASCGISQNPSPPDNQC